MTLRRLPRAPQSGPQSGPHLGLRLRATLVFVLVALLLTALTALTVWSTVSGYLVDRREHVAVAQALTHAQRVDDALDQGAGPPAELLAQLPSELASASLLLTEDAQWFSSTLSVDRQVLPTALREAVLSGQRVHQRFEDDGAPLLAVGTPLPGGGAYFEVFALDELERTFRALSVVLALAVVAIPTGTFLAGWWAMRPALRPLEHVASAAAAMAAGDVGARVDPGGDPALTSIARSFNATADALERRLRADARFAADVSHELRTPLTTVVAAVDHLAHYGDRLPDDGREVLALLGSEVARFERLVEDLLEMSRSDAGSVDLLLEPVRLAELVQHAVPPGLRDRVVTSPAGGAARVQVDKRRLERALSNLLDNAQRHGGGLLRLTVDADEQRAWVAVEDAGPGLDPDDLERVFDRFARGRSGARGRTEGAGLGLALVARHAALMAGSVRAENREEGGARFVLALPLAGDEP